MSDSYGEAIAKAFLAAGGVLPAGGGIFISVNDHDKNQRTADVVEGFRQSGFSVYATRGTSNFLTSYGVANTMVYKVNEGRPNIVDNIRNGDIQVVINTPLGEASRFDEQAIGRAALEEKILTITAISGAAAALKGIRWAMTERGGVRSLQEYQTPGHAQDA